MLIVTITYFGSRNHELEAKLKNFFGSAAFKVECVNGVREISFLNPTDGDYKARCIALKPVIRDVKVIRIYKEQGESRD
jgi:hypothetical protein